MDEDDESANFHYTALEEACIKLNMERNNTDSFMQSMSHYAKVLKLLLKSDLKQQLEERKCIQIMETIQSVIEDTLDVLKQNGSIESTMQCSFVCVGEVFCTTFRFCYLAGEQCNINGEAQDEELTQKLSSIFKQCYQNMKTLMDAVDSFEKVLPKNLPFLHSVLGTLVKCSGVLSGIDILASVTVWKTIKKLYLQHRELVRSVPFDELFQLCDITSTTITTLFGSLEKKDTGLTSKYQKVTRFFLGIVLLLVDDFKGVMSMDTGHKVFKLILLIQKWSLLETRKQFELKDCSSEYETMHTNILCVNDPLIKTFLQSENASVCIIKGSLVMNNSSNEEFVAVAGLQVAMTVLEYLTEHTECHSVWMELKQPEQPGSILEVVFALTKQCSSSMFGRHKEYSITDKTKCQKETSLYQIVLGKMCAFIVTLCSNHFLILEKVLLQQVLFGVGYSALLATDLWSFVARWGKPDLCLSHFLFLGDLLLSLNEGRCAASAINNVSFLLRRLFWFLEDNQHAKVLEKYPVSRSSTIVWKVIPVIQMKTVDTNYIFSQIIQVFLSLTEELTGAPANETKNQMIIAIECVSSLLSSDPDLYQNLDKVVRHGISECVSNFWKKFTDAEETIEVDVELISAMLDLTSSIISHLPGTCVNEILTTICDVLYNSSDVSFQLGCAHMLSSLRTMEFDAKYENCCLEYLSKMFQFLLMKSDWVIEDASMRALQQFAQETKYSRALLKFLPAVKKKEFTSFLKKEASGPDDDVAASVFKCISKQSGGNVDAILDKMENGAKELTRLLKFHDRPAELSERIDSLIILLRNAVSWCS